MRKKANEPVWDPPAPDVEPVGGGRATPKPKPSNPPSSTETTKPLPTAIAFPKTLEGSWKLARESCMQAALATAALKQRNIASASSGTPGSTAFEEILRFGVDGKDTSMEMRSVAVADGKAFGCVLRSSVTVVARSDGRLRLSFGPWAVERINVPPEGCTASMPGREEREMRYELVGNELLLYRARDPYVQEYCTANELIQIHARP